MTATKPIPYLAGVQRVDGSVDREIVVSELHPDRPLTVAQARQLARALVAAADEVDRLTYPQIRPGMLE